MLEVVQSTKGIIFDMDGVLFLSTDCHAKAFRLVTKKYFSQFEYSGVAGMRSDEAFRSLAEERGVELTESLLQTLVAEKRKYALQFLRERGKIADGVLDLLKALSKQYRLVLATSASTGTVDLFFELSKTREFFDHVLDGSSVTFAKPAPDIYLLAAEKLGLSPQECIVVEDAAKGAEAAFRAGIPLIITTQGPQEPFLQFQPLMVVSEVKEVASILF